MLYVARNLVIENSVELKIDYGSFEFKENFISIIKGKSGIGKTTLLKVLGLLSWNISAESEITLSLDGEKKSLNSLGWADSQKLREAYFTYILQDDHLVDSISVKDNILFPCFLLDKDAASIQEKFNDLLKKPFLSPIIDKLDESCSILSGGEKKKVALLRAILKDPTILIADEPWTNLGGNHHEGDVKDYTDFFIEQRKNKSTILATHDEDVIKKYGAYDFVKIFELVEKEDKGRLRILAIKPVN